MSTVTARSRQGVGTCLVAATASLSLLMCGVCVLLPGCSRSAREAAEAADQVSEKPKNRLSRETSPYLLQHAHNPVDWYPWGPEAFEKAKSEKKLIFLSVGYSSCHWCHVMEKKVFSDPTIAKLMNEQFINIKVDREERPDIDEIYMMALSAYYQLIGVDRAGGWPLSMFLTPEGKPLAGGTYFPPADEENRTGFVTVMKRITELWRDKNDEMRRNADLLSRAVELSLKPKLVLQPVPLEAALVERVRVRLEAGHDAKHGGFGFDAKDPDRSKFPQPSKLEFLQHTAVAKKSGAATDEPRSPQEKLTHTLDHMAAGGIYDQLGGGFHRYSTDRAWRVPHFEKMLYDNAQLADVYAEAFHQTRTERYREITQGCLDFVLRELTDPQGGFYSALDADSEGVEGKFYAWSDKELESLLKPEELQLAKSLFGIGSEPDLDESHVLVYPHSLTETAAQLGVSEIDLRGRIDQIRSKLWFARQQRKRPLRDDKILTSWNGLMIRALANAGTKLNRRDYLQSAEKSALFLLAALRNNEGRLLHSYRGRASHVKAYLDDYAFLVDGLLALHAGTQDEKWRNAAVRLTDQQIELFWDERYKGCFFTPHDHEVLLARTKGGFDTVLPSGNSVTARNLVRLWKLTGQAKYLEHAKQTLEAFAPALQDGHPNMTGMALAMAEYLQAAALAAKPGPAGRNGVGPARGPANDGTGGSGTSGDNGPGESGSASATTPGGAASDGAVASGAGTTGRASSGKRAPVVTAQAYLDVDRLPAGRICTLLVALEIAEGWHINSNPAQPDHLEATDVSVESVKGTRVLKVAYPVGELHDLPAIKQKARYYSGRVPVLVTLEVPPAAAGQIERLTVTILSQACNDKSCLPVRSTTIEVPVEVTLRDEPATANNADRFRAARAALSRP